MDFSPVRVVTAVNIAFVTKSYLEKSQTYRGDGINDEMFYTCIQILVVALSAILVLFTGLILSSVLGCIAIIQLIIDQHIKHFEKDRILVSCAVVSVSELQNSLIINHWQVTLPIGNILNSSVFFCFWQILITWWKMFPWFRFLM